MSNEAPSDSSEISPSISTEPHGNWLAVLSVSLAAFALVTSEFLPFGILQTVADELNVSPGQAGMMITLPGIMGALTSPFLCVMIKEMDRRILLLVLTAIMVIANIMTGLTERFDLLLISRTILGVAIGGFWAIAIALSGRLTPPHLPIAKATAIVMAGVTLATVLGVPIGTWLSSMFGWRTAFLLTAGLGAVVFIFQCFFLPKLPTQSAIRFRDLPALFTDPKARQGLLVIMLIGFAHFSTFSYLSPFFRANTNFDGTTISTLLLVYGIAGFFGNMFAGYSSNINVRYTLAAVGLSFAIVFFSFPVFATQLTGAYLLTMLWGFAFGAFPTSGNIWMFIHAPHAVEKGMPLFVGIFQVNIALGALYGGYVVDHFSTHGLLYSVLIFIALAIVSIFTYSRGLNNPKVGCPT